jgi:hypothetical protein
MRPCGTTIVGVSVSSEPVVGVFDELHPMLAAASSSSPHNTTLVRRKEARPRMGRL